MIIKILGTGCSKCKALQASVEVAVKQLGLDATIEKIEDINDIIQYDLMSAPGLVIDEKLIMAGKIPSVDELVKILPNLASYKKESECESSDKKTGGCSCGGSC